MCHPWTENLLVISWVLNVSKWTVTKVMDAKLKGWKVATIWRKDSQQNKIWSQILLLSLLFLQGPEWHKENLLAHPVARTIFICLCALNNLVYFLARTGWLSVIAMLKDAWPKRLNHLDLLRRWFWKRAVFCSKGYCVLWGEVLPVTKTAM